MNFIKLKNNLDVGDYSIFETHNSYGLVIDGIFKGIKYSSVKTDLRQKLFELIPLEHRHHFDISAMQVNVKIPPHTDSNITATINFYIKTDNCITRFYSLKTDKPKTTQVENQTTGYLFAPEDLEPAGQFEAKPGEVWLLNVSKPHSVLPLTTAPLDRVALCLQSRKFNFEETIELLKATGNL
jgi:hypothetical protein